MVQLIISVMAIALTALTVLASISYIPWWYKKAADTDQVLRASLTQLEKGYKAATRTSAGVAPTATGTGDGGFDANFRPVLGLLPRAPGAFTWSYHQHPADSSAWAGLNYFCLTSTEDGSEGEWHGFKRAGAVFSAEQYVVSDTCGDTTSAALPSSYPAPLALTFFVTYVPGVDD